MRGAFRRLCLTLALIAQGAAAQTLTIDVAAIQAPEAVQEQLRKAVEARNWAQAETILYSLTQTGNPEPPLLEALAAAHLLCGRYLPSAMAYQRADRRAPLSAASRFALAKAYLGLEKRHWARRELERLARADPKNPLYPLELAGVFQQYQWFEMAEDQARRAIELKPGLVMAHDRLGEALEGRNEISAALSAYQTAVALESESRERSPWPAFHLGRLLLESGDAAQAEKALEAALTIDPDHADAVYERGMALRKLDRREEALAAFERAAGLRPRDPRVHYALAQTYRRLGKMGEAADALRRFRALSPE